MCCVKIFTLCFFSAYQVMKNDTISKKIKPSSGRLKKESEFWNCRGLLLQVISHPARLMILQRLTQGSQCVKEINSLLPDITQPQISQHMAALRKAELVDCHINGVLHCYYLTRPSLVKSLITLLAKEHPITFREHNQVVREAQKSSGLKKKKATRKS